MARALTEVGAVSGSRGGLRPGQRHQPHLVGADQGAWTLILTLTLTLTPTLTPTLTLTLGACGDGHLRWAVPWAQLNHQR